MHYEFVEIGTSDFETLAQSHPLGKGRHGMSIEPLRVYLDRLPDQGGLVVKVCAAISPDNRLGDLDMYYVPEAIIAREGFPDWLRGCNSLGMPHPAHLNADIAKYVEKETVAVLPLHVIFQIHEVTSIGVMKLDTEGLDCKILQAYAQANPGGPWPAEIRFEANHLTPAAMVDTTISIYKNHGYNLTQRTNHDAVLHRKAEGV